MPTQQKPFYNEWTDLIGFKNVWIYFGWEVLCHACCRYVVSKDEFEWIWLHENPPQWMESVNSCFHIFHTLHDFTQTLDREPLIKKVGVTRMQYCWMNNDQPRKGIPNFAAKKLCLSFSTMPFEKTQVKNFWVQHACFSKRHGYDCLSVTFLFTSHNPRFQKDVMGSALGFCRKHIF